MKIGRWEFNVGGERILGENRIAALKNVVQQWSATEAKIRSNDAANFSVREFGVPTILCRMDIAPFQQGCQETAIKSNLYEIEARPASLGILLSIYPQLIDQWKRVFRACGCGGFVSLKTEIQDDELAAKILDLPYFKSVPSQQEPFWIRTSPDDGQISEASSLVPIKKDGDKTYLLNMDIAREIKNTEDLPWENGFGIKPLQGIMCRDVLLWQSSVPSSKRGSLGIATRKKIQNTLANNEKFIIQPFIPPAVEDINGNGKQWTIWRIFFAYDVQRGQWEFAGGYWLRRPCMKIHGASDAVIGPLTD